MFNARWADTFIPEPLQCWAEHTGKHGISVRLDNMGARYMQMLATDHCGELLGFWKLLNACCLLWKGQQSVKSTQQLAKWESNISLPHPKRVQSNEMTAILLPTVPGSSISSQVATILEGQRVIREILRKTRWVAKDISSDDRGMTSPTAGPETKEKSKRLLRMTTRLFTVLLTAVTFYQKVR